MTRKVIDCRDFPSETNCTLMISGREFEVLQASAEHASRPMATPMVPNCESSFAP